jgi:multiple sugar transport system permease protein
MNLRKKEAIVAYIFSAPCILGCIIFFVIPFIISIYYCFTKGIGNVQYVGFQNFIDLFNSESFILAAKNTFRFMGINVPIIIIISLLIALILNSKLKKIEFFRTVSILPMVIPAASVLLVLQIFFNQYGVLNGIFLIFNIKPIDWLNSSWSFYILSIFHIWKNCGFNIIIFMVGLNNIPNYYYEAAKIDGSDRFKSFWKITLPLLVPTIFLEFIISIMNSFNVYREAYLLGGVYPNSSIYTLQHFMNNNITNLNYQRLSTASLLVFIIIVLFVYATFRLEKKFGSY